jgi:uncharacterized protein YciI
MLYAIVAEDAPGSLSLRTRERSGHRARLEALQAEGRLIMAGPFPAVDAADPGPAGFSGSLIVVDFPSQAEAQAWINDDPYNLHGVFRQITVRPFQQVFPK